jgi:hypothetical protein
MKAESTWDKSLGAAPAAAGGTEALAFVFLVDAAVVVFVVWARTVAASALFAGTSASFFFVLVEVALFPGGGTPRLNSSPLASAPFFRTSDAPLGLGVLFGSLGTIAAASLFPAVAGPRIDALRSPPVSGGIGFVIFFPPVVLVFFATVGRGCADELAAPAALPSGA